MCKCASFVVTKDRVYWSKTSDSHSEIVEENKLHTDGTRGVNVVFVEVSPANDNLSLPLNTWSYQVDEKSIRLLPKWYDPTECERNCREALKDWAKCKLNGWNVQEAFAPVNPLEIKTRGMSEATLRMLLQEWASVWNTARASVQDSVHASLGASVWNTVEDSIWGTLVDAPWNSLAEAMEDTVWDSIVDSMRASVDGDVWDDIVDSMRDSVGATVWASVWAYTGGLFPNIKEWKGAEHLGPDPWRPLLTLWYAGYVPSFDGTTWRLHAGANANIVLEWKKENK